MKPKALQQLTTITKLLNQNKKVVDNGGKIIKIDGKKFYRSHVLQALFIKNATSPKVLNKTAEE